MKKPVGLVVHEDIAHIFYNQKEFYHFLDHNRCGVMSQIKDFRIHSQEFIESRELYTNDNSS